MCFKSFIKAYNGYCNYPDTLPAPILRKTFDIDFVPQSCSLSICVSGFYELYINGKNITKGRLAPFVSNPGQVVYYDRYEVGDFLCQGKNAVAVILGNGYANQDFNYKQYSTASFRGPLVMGLELCAHGDGKSFSLSADESFRTHPSALLYDMYHLGTVYDARKEIPGFADRDFDDSLWNKASFADAPKGKIIPSYAEPVVKRYELTPVSVKKQEDFCYFYDNDGKPFVQTYVKEGWCYDFGVSRAGVCRIKIKGFEGQKITLRHCETLRDGKFCMNSIHTVNENSPSYFTRFQTDTYILKGGEEEIYVPSFTYHGFRYVLVEGIDENQATPDLLTYEVLSTHAEKMSDFKCSDNVLNTLYNMAIESDLSNYQHILTDCPQREKCGWTGDISMSAHQFVLSFDCFDNLSMWLEEARYSQREEGMLPGVIPTSGWGYSWGNGPVWDSAIVNVVYYLYKYYGRKDVIEENSDMIVRYLKYISGRRDDSGLIAIGLGDWCQPGRKDSQPDSPLVFTDSSQIYQTALRSAFLLEQIGRSEDMEYALNLAGEMKNAIRENLIDFSDMTVVGACQTSQALALRMGIFEENEKEKAYKKLLDIIERDKCTINCGMIGLRNLFHVLLENGNTDLALEMITKKNAPSYRDMIDRGGTALFESLTPNGMQESQNHHFYGDIINLFITKLAGININPHMTDIYEVCIAPHINKKMSFAEGCYKSDGNAIEVKWEKDKDKVKLSVNITGKYYGTLDFGGKIHQLKEGANSYEY